MSRNTAGNLVKRISSAVIVCTLIWLTSSCGAESKETASSHPEKDTDSVPFGFSAEGGGTYRHLESSALLPQSWGEWVRIEGSLQAADASPYGMSVSYRREPPMQAFLSMDIHHAETALHDQFSDNKKSFTSLHPGALVLTESLEDDMCVTLFLYQGIFEGNAGMLITFLFLIEESGWFTAAQVDMPADLGDLTDMDFVTDFLHSLPFFSIEETPYFRPSRAADDA